MEKLLKTDKDIEQFLFWIGTLKAEVFEKAKYSLQGNEDSYCCLGVGVICTTPEKKLELTKSNFLCGSLPHSQPSPEWLIDINDYISENIGGNITSKNDEYWSHPEIADWLMDKFEKGLL